MADDKNKSPKVNPEGVTLFTEFESRSSSEKIDTDTKIKKADSNKSKVNKEKKPASKTKGNNKKTTKKKVTSKKGKDGKSSGKVVERKKQGKKNSSLKKVAKKKPKSRNIDLKKLAKIKVIKIDKNKITIFKTIESKYLEITKAIKRVFSTLGVVVDKNINSLKALKIISLTLAILLYAFVNYQPDKKKITGNPELLRDIPVEIINESEDYVVEGLPEIADMLLIGSQTDLLRAINLKEYRVYLDLNGLGPGTHEVNLRASDIVTDIQVQLTPAKVTVQVFKKVSDTFTLTTDTININKKNPKLVLTDILLDEVEVIARGADYQVEKIVGIKVLIDASKIKNVGEVRLEDNQVVAYDAKGMPVDVVIHPATVGATVNVEAPSSTIPVRVKTINELEAGYAVEDFVIEPQFITIYAPQEILDKIPAYEVEIDLSSMAIDDELNDITKKFTISKQSGINLIVEETVSVTTSFSSETSYVLENLSFRSVGIGDGYTVNAKTASDGFVNVEVFGSSTLIDELQREDVEIFVDLTDLEPGEHQVKLFVEINDARLDYVLQKEKVTLIISEE